MPTLQMPEAAPCPVYCLHIINTLLEFVLTGVHIISLDCQVLLTNCNSRTYELVLFEAVPHAFYSSGSLPLMKSTYTELPCLVCPTSFTSSCVCLWKFTTKELVRFIDLPVVFENQLTCHFRNILTISCPLLQSIPLKLLQHVLYLSGVLEILALQELAQLQDGTVHSEGE